MNQATATQLNWAKLAHDLRGPLGPLRTVAWLMRNEPVGSSHTEAADILDRQTRRLARLIDELSDWGSVCGKQDPLHVTPVEVPNLLDVAIANIPDCQLQPVFTGDAMTFPLEGDQHQLGKLLHTIVAHAVHRDPGKHPSISIRATDGTLQIRVCDHGPALDVSTREALLTEPLAKPFDEGLGLRLLIARQIAEAHGGSLSFEPAEEGTCMLCVLPQTPG